MPIWCSMLSTFRCPGHYVLIGVALSRHSHTLKTICSFLLQVSLFSCLTGFRVNITTFISAMVLYDYILTFDRELRFVWACKQSLGTILFYGFRYPAMINIVLVSLARTTAPDWQSLWVSHSLVHMFLRPYRFDGTHVPVPEVHPTPI